MLHHLALTAADLARSGPFYDAVLGVLGYRRAHSRSDLLVWTGPQPEILLYAATPEQQNARHHLYDPGFHHAAFQVGSRDIVNECAELAVASGGRLLEAPRLFPNYAPDYYACFFEDPDGLKLEVMTLTDTSG